MRLSVSNIAWDSTDRIFFYETMAQNGIRGLEIAPALFLWDTDDPFRPDQASVRRARMEIRAHGLLPVSMQALLFGVKGASLFGTKEERSVFEAAMERAVRLGGALEIPNLVFGSPKQREVPAGMTDAEARTVAGDVFSRLGDLSQKVGTRISIEANPKEYGTNFWTDPGEVANFLEAVENPGLGLTLDMSTLCMGLKRTAWKKAISACAKRTTHAHVSLPFLAAPEGGGFDDDAGRFFAALRSVNYSGFVSLEMKSNPDTSVTANSIEWLARRAGKK